MTAVEKFTVISRLLEHYEMTFEAYHRVVAELAALADEIQERTEWLDRREER